ncbi:MAG: response regulator [Microcoleus sp. PH2017_29_MFU_D_A]|uniref:adenylate/guanylate cyclase domain-containing protein n=1 Tax=unclassified Microcoleus TaxID=2642155 RepID=UPI001DBB28EE|nr:MULTISPECIES: adenylate/guanylate cyclase domain-containing protein [unclassified Microcoleus]MCC3419026.1 response regulator [Microcoleus sp. PH2017_07_MST_O_A]MCC3428632.1 response regulator [Microcoleus sp. PH2017_04_SCI_O_A]MCC3441140.1 response regulator [Microcoleus sp. PH2017_03_ELD_O_A]MCC3467805.1 response regulator [Microcoleus sp. PH2017_06_SFM_O_A]MCC3502998.1 response regulator [Microcoleus sp. PH2017_19_SFW_U_A]MCC3511605.1 response regulator [Microcoleus sp. PH2017_17_BER_D_
MEMKAEQTENYQADILVVDDTPDNLRLLIRILQKNGYKVRPVTNGFSAIDAIQSSVPDLILLDIMMPDINGYELCQKLKVQPQFSEIPIIFISALEEGIDKAKAFEVGGADYITKPFQVKEVLARVSNQLTVRSLQMQLQEKNQKLTDQNVQLHQEIADRRQVEMETRLLLEATQAISKSDDFESAIDVILGLICQTIEWNLGEAWIPNSDGVLRCARGRYVSDLSFAQFRQTSWQLTFAPGAGLPGRIWQSQQSEWIEDVSTAPEQVFLRSEIAVNVGLRAAFGLPILADNQVLAILIFYREKVLESQPRLLELVSAVATQLGSLIQRKQAEAALKLQQKQTEKLLLNILPKPIAERLQKEQKLIADHFDEVTVLFADLVGFTEFSAHKSPTQLVEILNGIFSEFDRLSELHGLEKIKTIGDAYMVVGGLPTARPDHSEAIALLALDMQVALRKFNLKIGEGFQLRIGIHSGSVVAGIIGISKFSYDLWGDTVNVASRMESNGLPGKIQVTAKTYERLKEQFIFEERGPITVKGKGTMLTYWLLEEQTQSI